MRSLGVHGELGSLKAGESTAELRFVNHKGQTEAWIIQLGSDYMKLQRRVYHGEVIAAYIDDGVDSRLANQAETIDRLTKHIAYHHDQLGMVPAEACPILKGEVKL